MAKRETDIVALGERILALLGEQIKRDEDVASFVLIVAVNNKLNPYGPEIRVVTDTPHAAATISTRAAWDLQALSGVRVVLPEIVFVEEDEDDGGEVSGEGGAE